MTIPRYYTNPIDEEKYNKVRKYMLSGGWAVKTACSIANVDVNLFRKMAKERQDHDLEELLYSNSSKSNDYYNTSSTRPV